MNSYSDPGQHIFWILSRASGVVALILAAVSVGMGLAMAMRAAKGPGAMARLKQAHEATALATLIFIAAHGLTLLGDSYLRPGLAGIAIPFVMSHKPLWTGLGIIGGWLAALLGLSFYVRRWIGPKLWRKMHRWTLAVYALAVVHTLGAGTDARSLWLLVILIATVAPLAVMAAIRLLPSDEPAGRRPRRRIPLPSEQLSRPVQGQPLRLRTSRMTPRREHHERVPRRYVESPRTVRAAPRSRSKSRRPLQSTKALTAKVALLAVIATLAIGGLIAAQMAAGNDPSLGPKAAARASKAYDLESR